MKKIYRKLIFIFAVIYFTSFAVTPINTYAMLFPTLTEESNVESDQSLQESLQSPPSATAPRVIVSDFTVQNDGLIPGEVSTITYTLKNTSDSIYVYSIIVSWWVDSSAPLEFIKTNQEYIPSIAPSQEVEVKFNVRTKSIDLSTVNSIPSSIQVSYKVPGLKDSNNNVMIQLPVYHSTEEPKSTVEENKISIPASIKDDFLSSIQMQIVYIGALGASIFGILVIYYRKFKNKNNL